MMNPYRILWILLCCLPSVLPAQIRVDHAEGQWEVSRDITPDQAEQRALLEAKRKALQLAGIPENINALILSLNTVDKLNFEYVFTQISTLQILAQVKVLKEDIYRDYDPATGRLIIRAVIAAEVLPPSKETQMAQFTLSDLKYSYRAGDQVRFSLTPGVSCYFHFFVFDTTGGTCFYPNTYEKRICLQPDTTYAFPLNQLLEYSIDRKNHSARYEQNIVIAVATLRDLPFRGEVTVPCLFDWLYTIPPHERVEAYYSFLVE